MRRFQDLTDDEYRLFREYVSSAQYYLLLGSGVSLDSTGSSPQMRSAGELRTHLNGMLDLPGTTSLQQAYSILDEKQTEEQLTDHYTCRKPGPTIETIAFNPWKRVYTLNIDNCFEEAFKIINQNKGFDLKQFENFNFDDSFSDVSPGIRVSIIHLHGFVEFSDRGYIFSHAEYAKNMARPNSWMLTLSQLIRTEPFIVVGTSLEEIDVTYYLEQRATYSVRGDVPPSIIVEPNPNKLTERLCAQHGFCLFEGTAAVFFEEIARLHNGQQDFWVDRTDNLIEELIDDRVSRLQFSATYETVPVTVEKDRNPARFLIGSELEWGMLESGIDVSRDISISLQGEIASAMISRHSRVFLIVDEPGSGKSALLKRLAYDLSKTKKLVFWHSGHTRIDSRVCSKIFDGIDEDCFVFVDNWADNYPHFLRVLQEMEKSNILIVCSERSYRMPYIETGMAEEEYKLVRGQLGLTDGEAIDLVKKNEEEGLSTFGKISPARQQAFARRVLDQPIAIAACRIQNNFKPFDQIVRGLIKDSDDAAQKFYATVAISRFCYSGGVRRSVLFAATQSDGLARLFSSSAILPLKYVDRGKQFIVPNRSVVADRMISLMANEQRTFMIGVFIDLAVSLAPHVNPRQIQMRSPESRLAARLLDFDQVVKDFINDGAEFFYEEIKEHWSWNSRYWEQLALLRFDRYLVDRNDKSLLEESIQHARHAYSIQRHPLSLTTLAKLLFNAMGDDKSRREELFEEAWELISEAIDIESKWLNIRSTAFIVCFNGVINYIENGGLLTGKQTDNLRDIMATTFARKLRDSRLDKLRGDLQSIAL